MPNATAAKRQCILHIGTEKTGSTSIQNVMAALREQLPLHGFAYPRSPGSRNHTRLALFAGDEKRTKAMARREKRIHGDDSVGDWLPDQLATEIEALPADVHTVVFSNEHCHSRLTDAESVERLKALLDAFFDRYRVVVYLRRQDELAVSRYSTMLRTGGFTREVLPMHLTTMLYFQYDALLDRWGQVFGRDNLVPRLFGREHFVEGDLMRDFFAVCGLPPLAIPEDSATRNPSLIPAAQEFLLRFNQQYQRAKDLGRPAWVGEFMNAEFAGPSRLPPRADAMAFCAAFDAGNERIRSEFFPQRQTLFSTDFRRYPEVETPPVPEAEVLDVALRVLCHISPQVGRQGKAKTKTPEPQPDVAADPIVSLADERASLLALLDEEPTQARALRRLIRIALDPADREVALARLEKARALAPEREDLPALASKLGTARRLGKAPKLGKKKAQAAA